MRRLISLICIAVALLGIQRAAASEPLFPLPAVPDNLDNLQQRSNYFVHHFWDECNLNTAFSSRARLNTAVGTWFGLMPYASADTAHMSVNALLDKLKKKPENLLVMGQMAEGWLWADTSSMHSDELYLPFAKAVADNKKISKAERARFAAHAKIIESSSPGLKLPALELTAPDGSKALLSDTTGRQTFVLFMDPDCDDCRMAQIRLANDFNAKQLVEKGVLEVICIYPGDPNDARWAAWTTTAPEGWRIYAAPEADDYFDLRISPAMYYAAPNGVILAKNVPVDNLINALPYLNK